MRSTPDLDRLLTRRPCNARTRVSCGDEGRLLLRRYTGSPVTGVFLAVWLAGWSAGCLTHVRQLLAQPTPQLILSTLPVLSCWLLVFGLSVYSLLGYEHLAIQPGGLGWESGSLLPLWRRTLPLRAVKRVTPAERSSFMYNQLQSGLIIETTDESLPFGFGLGEEELSWLRRLMNACLSEARRSDERTSGRDEDGARSRSSGSLMEGDRVVLTRTRSLDWPFFGLLTFVNAFWNGIVVAMIYELWDGMRPATALSLAPFIGFGAAVFCVWAAAIGSALVKEQATFDTHEVEVRRALWIFAVTQRIATHEVQRLEFRNRPAGRWRDACALWQFRTHSYDLTCLLDDNREMVLLGDFSKSEALGACQDLKSWDAMIRW